MGTEEAFLLISINEGYENSLINELKKQESVREVYKIESPSYNLLARVECKSMEEFKKMRYVWALPQVHAVSPLCIKYKTSKLEHALVVEQK